VKIFLGILFSSILSRWNNQLILCSFIYFAIFSPLLISSSSRFVLLFHFPSTNTHSEYVTLIAFPLQQWLYVCASMLHYTFIACLCYIY
jgi:hypothetical protein